MGRKLRVQYPGAIDQVMNRGDRREAIFRDDQDRQRFLKTLGKIKLAAHLREETTMTLKWIAQRLQMGAWTHLNKRLYEHRKASGAMKVA